MGDKPLITIQKNSIHQIQVRKVKYQGKDLINVRIWYLDHQDNTYNKPTRKRISFNLDKWGEFKKAISSLK